MLEALQPYFHLADIPGKAKLFSAGSTCSRVRARSLLANPMHPLAVMDNDPFLSRRPPLKVPIFLQQGYGLLHLSDLAGYERLSQPLRLLGIDFFPAPGTPKPKAFPFQVEGIAAAVQGLGDVEIFNEQAGSGADTGWCRLQLWWG